MSWRFNRAKFTQKPFEMVDTRLTWQSAEARWSIEGCADNLTDEDGINELFQTRPLFGSPIQAACLSHRTCAVRSGYGD